MYSDDSEHSESEFYNRKKQIFRLQVLIIWLKTENVVVATVLRSIAATATYNSTSKLSGWKTRRKRQNMIWMSWEDSSSLSNNEFRAIENIPANELNTVLARFFVNIRKRNGDVYKPSSLTAFQRSLQRYCYIKILQYCKCLPRPSICVIPRSLNSP